MVIPKSFAAEHIKSNIQGSGQFNFFSDQPPLAHVNPHLPVFGFKEERETVCDWNKNCTFVHHKAGRPSVAIVFV